MKFRWLAVLYLVNIALLVGVATQESTPGYMDADYYFGNGLRIATVGDWNEPFIWNYLGEPQGLPNPAFSYWMPLAGVVSAIGISLSGMANFWGARIGFILIAGFLAPLTAYMAYSFAPYKWAALLSGSIALFSGFYFAYLPTTETFAIYMVLGGIFFFLVFRLQRDFIQLSTDSELHRHDLDTQIRRINSPAWVYLLMGLVCGLMFLTRIDGVIWLGLAGIAIIFQWIQVIKFENLRGKSASNFYGIILPLAFILFPFVLITSPWFFRNIEIFGSLFAPGTGRALWLTGYDEIFTYPASILTYERWLNSGIFELLRIRGWALGLNSLTTFAVQGGIILFPMILVGIWAKRTDWRVILAVCGWLVTFLMMTFVFSHQGARGGFFHAGAGFQPLFWALVPSGLIVITKWAANTRNWEIERALRMFASGTVIIIILITVVVTRQRLLGSSQYASAWGSIAFAYQEVESYLVKNGIGDEEIVMVNNPPGYYAMTGRQSIVIPHGDLNSVLLAGKNYQANYLILDENYPQGLEEIYKYPGDFPGMQYMDTINRMQIYSIGQ